MRDFSLTKGALVTPSDTEDLPEPGIGIQVAVAGKVKVTLLDGDILTLPLAAGIPIPWQVKRVWETGTDAAVLADTIHVGW